MTPEQQAYVEKKLALIERGGNCDHEAFVVDRIWGMGEDNLAKVDPPVVGLCNTNDSYYIQYFKNREEIEKFIEAVRKASDEAWGPPEPVNVYPFCGVVKMPEGWNTFANQETDTNPSETISNPEIDRSECIALLEVMQGEDGKECYYKTLVNDLPFGGYELYLAREPAHGALGAALKEWFPIGHPEDCDDVYMKRGIFTHGWIEAERCYGIGGEG